MNKNITCPTCGHKFSRDVKANSEGKPVIVVCPVCGMQIRVK